MRRLLWTLAVAVFLLLPRISQGCGDKLLILGRGLRFSALSSDRPVAILAYAPANSLLSRVLQEPQWGAAMAKGKHRLKVVESADELQVGLSRERYDLVVFDLADVAQLKQRARSASFTPLLVPTVDGATHDQIQTAQREYGVALRSGSKSKAYLSEISKAVELQDRRAQALVQARKSGKAS
jgi:hypothetical protein